jgi:hypothetical protein
MVHRQADLSYRQSNQLLAIEELHLPAKVYYNSHRIESQQTNTSQLDTLFQALESGGFHYCT